MSRHYFCHFILVPHLTYLPSHFRCLYAQPFPLLFTGFFQTSSATRNKWPGLGVNLVEAKAGMLKSVGIEWNRTQYAGFLKFEASVDSVHQCFLPHSIEMEIKRENAVIFLNFHDIVYRYQCIAFTECWLCVSQVFWVQKCFLQNCWEVGKLHNYMGL